MRLFAGALLAVIFLAACGPASSTSPSAPTSPSPSAPAVAMDPDALVAAAAANDGQVVRVKGFLLVTDVGATMCSVVLESYPPQCGGGALRITGEVPADVAAGLDKTSEPGLAQASWGWVEVVGAFDAASGPPTVAISEVRLAAP